MYVSFPSLKKEKKNEGHFYVLPDCFQQLQNEDFCYRPYLKKRNLGEIPENKRKVFP